MSEAKKKKILLLSDHMLSVSGVGTQSRHLIEGLVKKGNWTVRQLGAAIKHSSYETVVVNADIIIKPIDGFGDKNLLRFLLAQEKPDVIMIFTDPRFFLWLFEMEDEIHQVCPIVWWHVWDNRPTPLFNNALYEATDLLNCHSYLTYEMCKENFPNKTNFVPHGIPESMFFKMTQAEIENYKQMVLGEKKSYFTGIWVNRNAKRKRSNDVIVSWSIFLNELEKKHGHRNANLIMHTDPHDTEGPNLIYTANELGVTNNILFSRDRIGFDKMNVLYNISDFCINISYAEGFGLSTLESMQTGTPIIALKTGGMTRQVVDHRDNSENGIALPVEFTSYVGSQQVPTIAEDYVSNETVAKKIMQMYEMGSEKRTELGEKARQYALSEFNLQNTIDTWDKTLSDTIENWRKNYTRWQQFDI